MPGGVHPSGIFLSPIHCIRATGHVYNKAT